MATEVIQFKANTSSPNIDLETRTIRGVIIAKVGEAKGHGFHVEQEFIDAISTLSNKAVKKQVKSFFGHNWNNLGKQVGNITNVRVDGLEVKGDLVISASADISPVLPNMGEYLLALSQEDKTAVMLSVRFESEYYYQYDKANTRIKVFYYDKETGSWVRPIKEHGKVFIKMKDLLSIDLVDQGALTEKLFSEDTAIHQFQDLINTPEFPQLLETHYQEFRVLNDFYSNKNQSTLGKLFTEFKQIMSGENTDLNKLQDNYNALQSQLDASTESIKGLQARLELASKSDDSDTKDIQSKLDLATKKATDLQTDLDAKNTQITELEKGASTSHTSDDGEGDEGTTDLNAEPWLKDDINQRAMSAYGDA